MNDHFLEVYATYLAKYIDAYKQEGVEIDFIIPQNEPLHSANGNGFKLNLLNNMLLQKQTFFLTYI